MWHTGKRRFARQVLSKESLPATHFGYSKHPLPARRRFLRATVHAHPFVAATEKEFVSGKEAECLVTGVMASRFVTMQWLCSQLCCEIAANQRTFFEIELLATVGWKWAASLSAADVLKMWLTATGDLWDMLVFRNPFLPFLLGIPSIHFLPERGSWERQ